MDKKYPYFIYPDVIALREIMKGKTGISAEHPENMERMRRRVAANVGDIPSLRLMLGMDPEEFARFYPDMTPANLSTNDTIDTFLNRFGKPDAPVSKATAEIGTDYLSGTDTSGMTETVTETYRLEDMDSERDIPEDTTSSAIDSFLASMSKQNHQDVSIIPATEATGVATDDAIGEVPQNGSELHSTEADAHDCIKNHDYQRALEIIMRLSLNNPEKSIYFADQIRFLRKLILNQTKQDNRNSSQKD